MLHVRRYDGVELARAWWDAWGRARAVRGESRARRQRGRASTHSRRQLPILFCASSHLDTLAYEVIVV